MILYLQLGWDGIRNAYEYNKQFEWDYGGMVIYEYKFDKMI